MSRKLMVRGALGVLGLAALAYVKPWKRSARTMRNDQGVGPSHLAGVPRGEALSANGSEGPSSVAGRITGSIHPE